MRRTGACAIEELPENCLDPSFPRPPEADEVHVALATYLPGLKPASGREYAVPLHLLRGAVRLRRKSRLLNSGLRPSGGELRVHSPAGADTRRKQARPAHSGGSRAFSAENLPDLCNSPVWSALRPSYN